MSRPREMRALALVMRLAEQSGIVESTPDLCAIVEASGFSPEEIDRAFHLLVSPDGSTVGGEADLTDLDGFRVGLLVLNEMIEIGEDGQRGPTERGAALSNLLTEYARPKRRWRCRGDAASFAGLFASDWSAE